MGTERIDGLQNNTKSSTKKRKSGTAFTGRAPSYLYKRGNILYFRYVFSAEEQKCFGSTEIRISLQTGFLQESKKIARFLRVYLNELLMDDTLHLPDIKAKIQEVVQKKRALSLAGATGEPPFSSEIASDIELINARKMRLLEAYLDKKDRESLALELKALLEEIPKKQPPTIDDIRQRMNELLRCIINAIDECLYNPPYDTTEQGQQKEPPHVGVSRYFTILKISSNDPNNLRKILYPDLILELLQEGIFDLKELTTTCIEQILNEYGKIQISLNRILQARANGNYGFEKPFLQNSAEHNTIVSTKQKKQPSVNLNDVGEKKLSYTLSMFIEKYKDVKLKDKEWTERNISTHIGRLEFLIFVLGDKSIDTITRDDMRSFRDILQKLPPNRTKLPEYKGKTVDEIIAINPEKTLNAKTINTILQTVSGMFEWAIREGYLDTNPAKALSVNDDRQSSELKESFTVHDLIFLFFSGDYKYKNFDNPAYYWVPLIGLYSGMRLEEISQLHCEDLYEEDGIWVFDIREESSDGLHDKHIKTKNAKRKIPVHDKLVELGLLYYLQDIQTKSPRLFPQLNKTAKTFKYGKQVGKHFSALVKAKGIEGKKSFHSLRHTFDDFFKRDHTQEKNIFKQVFGHEIKDLATNQYGSKYPPKQCYDEIISKLHYEGEEGLIRTFKNKE